MKRAANSKAKAVRTRQTLIYVVDDQPLLLELAETALNGAGYLIKKFQDPAEALENFRSEKDQPVLLISDFAMDRMNGLELMEACKKLQPKLKTILLSGTMGAEVVLEAPVQVDRFLGKPYQPSNLLELVRRVLES